MGISINIAVQLARISPHLKDARNGLMLGRQRMHFREEWVTRLIRKLGRQGISANREQLFQDDGYCETYLRTIGWPPMESLDFTDAEGAEHVHDLSAPLPEHLKGQFDLVYDGGTTEHVFDIAQAFRNCHAMLRPGGCFVSCVGGDGWFGHGFYQVGPDVPWRYWGATLGYDVLGCWTMPRIRNVDPMPIPDPTNTRRGAEQSFDAPQFLFYVVRSNGPQSEYPPTIQSHYV